DFSTWEMWGALGYGGRLVIVPYWESRTPDAFYELLRDQQVTVLNQTPSAFKQLMQAEEDAIAAAEKQDDAGAHLSLTYDSALRVIIFGGEALDLRSLRSWYQRHNENKPQLVNMYGITETTVHVTYRALTREDVDLDRGSVIGWRIPDLQVYILDESLKPVPV